MNIKPIFAWIFSIVIFSIFLGYSLVFAQSPIFENTTKMVFQLSDNIYLDSLKLSNTKIVFKSNQNLSGASIESQCNIFSKLGHNKGDYYMFEIKFFDNKCSSESFVLVNENNEIMSRFQLQMVTEYGALSKMLDLDTPYLQNLEAVLDEKIEKFTSFSKYDRSIEPNYYNYLKWNRVLAETQYNKSLIQNIIAKRDEKYAVPVPNHVLPSRHDKLPNANRPYRENYTDGVHHSWDIDTKLWEDVIALDDGIILRVVRDWKWSDFNSLKYGTLTDDEKMKNLDILRGNQVWLKTMKWDVVFYGHLWDIINNITEGEVVRKWELLGTVWISWVPDKSYNDYHLDFSVRKNPRDEKKIWSYDFDDYMRWDWLFKWESREYILENQNNHFES